MRTHILQASNKQDPVLAVVYQEISMDEFMQGIYLFDIYDWFRDETIVTYKVADNQLEENIWIHISHQKRLPEAIWADSSAGEWFSS